MYYNPYAGAPGPSGCPGTGPFPRFGLRLCGSRVPAKERSVHAHTSTVFSWIDQAEKPVVELESLLTSIPA